MADGLDEIYSTKLQSRQKVLIITLMLTIFYSLANFRDFDSGLV